MLGLEQFISNLLKYDVLLASALVLMGGILYLIRHGAEPADYRFFQGTPAEFCSLGGVVTAVLSGSSRGIIQLSLFCQSPVTFAIADPSSLFLDYGSQFFPNRISSSV